MMALIALKADYIYKADTIYKQLEEFEELFEIEAGILGYAKCVLMQEAELDDFAVSGIYVSVYDGSEGYDLYFLNYVMTIDVYDKQIVNYNVRNLSA